MTLHPEVSPSQSTRDLPGCGKGQSGERKDRLAQPVRVLAGPGVRTARRLVPTPVGWLSPPHAAVGEGQEAGHQNEEAWP